MLHKHLAVLSKRHWRALLLVCLPLSCHADLLTSKAMPISSQKISCLAIVHPQKTWAPSVGESELSGVSKVDGAVNFTISNAGDTDIQIPWKLGLYNPHYVQILQIWKFGHASLHEGLISGDVVLERDLLKANKESFVMMGITVRGAADNIQPQNIKVNGQHCEIQYVEPMKDSLSHEHPANGSINLGDKDEISSEGSATKTSLKDDIQHIHFKEEAGTKHWIVDTCASTLQIPKVALMFLTKGDLFFEKIWKAWFQSAEGLLPLGSVLGNCRDSSLLEEARKACVRQEDGIKGVLRNQHLFNVYIHVGLNNLEFEGYAEDTIWHDRDILDRIYVEWGQHSLVLATRNLIRVALHEPLNQKFLLVSESGIPLYPPTTLYHQLIFEDKSRINSCIVDELHERHIRRWTDDMETEFLKKEHWRKSNQWMALTREHAKLATDDIDINQIFHEHCYYEHNEKVGFRDCYSDEHYFATLFAALGRDNETDCTGSSTYVYFNPAAAHPLTFQSQDINVSLIRALRMPKEHCDSESAIRDAKQWFILAAELNQKVCEKERPQYLALGPKCPLLARKFAPETVGGLLHLLSECNTSLGVLPAEDCSRT